MTEQEYLKTYDITQFDRPSLTTDMVLFALDRENPDKKRISVCGLQVLFIKRNNHPYQGKWALPGGFCHPEESILETAHRELQEETGVDAVLHLSDTYSKRGRDPRGWIISNAYYGFLAKEDCCLRADTDAWEARWFTIRWINQKQDITGNLRFYDLILEAGDERLNVTLEQKKTAIGCQETWETEELYSDFAFDHGTILLETILQMQEAVRRDVRLLFGLFPERFTIGELEQAYTQILREPVLNFRRKVADLVEKTGEQETAAHRPAEYYKRK